jgi:hypothetical protein
MMSFLGLQREQAAIGVLEGGMHVRWGQMMDGNLGEHEVFGHFEERLGHDTFLLPSAYTLSEHAAGAASCCLRFCAR